MKWKLEIELIGTPETELFRQDVFDIWGDKRLCAASLKNQYRNHIYWKVLDGQMDGEIGTNTKWQVLYDADKSFDELRTEDKGKILFDVLYCYKCKGDLKI